MKSHYKTVIIGGGAAGMYAAALFAGVGRGGDVLLIERGARLGKKLSASGNGQGNVGNSDIGARHYFGGGRQIAEKIIDTDVLAFFGGIFVTDERGRIYPASRQASSVTDELRRKIDAGGVDVLLDCAAQSVTRSGGAFTVNLQQMQQMGTQQMQQMGTGASAESSQSNNFPRPRLSVGSGGKRFTADSVILACGGKAQNRSDVSGYALAEGFGHKITPLFPSLVQLKTDTSAIKTLKGLRTDCRITAISGGKAVQSALGEIIFADYGVTGSAVFAVSPYIAGSSDVTLEIEFLPAVTEDTLLADIQNKYNAGRRGEELLALTFHNQLARAIVRASDGSPKSIARAAKRFPLTVTGTLGFDHAQVTRGGVDFSDVTDGLESKLCPGLYFAGEILDVDGECGGYNLHWAFASARRVYESITK